MGRGSLSDVSEENAEILGGNEKEERPLTCHSDIEGAVQGKEWTEVAHIDNIRHHGVGDCSEEVGGEMVIRVSGKRRTVGGLRFLEKGIREDKDSGFR